MVEVLENCSVDMDVKRDAKEQHETAAQPKQASPQTLPVVPEQSAGANATSAGQAVTSVLHGSVEGIVKPTGNAFGVLSGGLVKNVGRFGESLGNAASYGGRALFDTGTRVGSMGELHGAENRESEQDNPVQVDIAWDMMDADRRKTEHKENVKALEEFGRIKPIKTEDNGARK